MFEPRSSDERDRVELGLFISEVGRLQDVAALSVLAEQALVQIHLCAPGLDVEGHWRRRRRRCTTLKCDRNGIKMYSYSSFISTPQSYRFGSRRSTEVQGRSWRNLSLLPLRGKLYSACPRYNGCTQLLQK